ncbi:MAG: FAD binding domain-containing protein, partial [Angelakisella sp.]
MKEFNYFAPGSVEEALELMKEYEGKYTILNGGTDVMIRLRERLINPEAVIDIKRIPGLKEITFSKKDGLYIGACVTCKEISESEIVKENYPFYAQAASVLGSQLV